MRRIRRGGDLHIKQNDLVKIFFQQPGIIITIHNREGNIYNAIGCLERLKNIIGFVNPFIRVYVNTQLMLMAETARGKVSIIKVEQRFVRPTKEITRIIGEELQHIDQKTFDKMIDDVQEIFPSSSLCS